MGHPCGCSRLLPSWLNKQVAWVQPKMDHAGFEISNDLIFEVLKDKKGRGGGSDPKKCNSSCHIHSPRQFSANVAALGVQCWAGVCDYTRPSCNNQWTMKESTPRLSQFNLKGWELREKELRAFLCWVDLSLITGTSEEFLLAHGINWKVLWQSTLRTHYFYTNKCDAWLPMTISYYIVFFAFHPRWILLNGL